MLIAETITITQGQMIWACAGVIGLSLSGALFYWKRRAFLKQRYEFMEQDKKSRIEEENSERQKVVRKEVRKEDEHQKDMKQARAAGEWFAFYRQLEQVNGSTLRLVFLNKVIDEQGGVDTKSLPRLSMAGLSLFADLFYSSEKKTAEDILTHFVDFSFPKTGHTS